MNWVQREENLKKTADIKDLREKKFKILSLKIDSNIYVYISRQNPIYKDFETENVHQG